MNQKLDRRETAFLRKKGEKKPNKTAQGTNHSNFSHKKITGHNSTNILIKIMGNYLSKFSIAKKAPSIADPQGHWSEALKLK